jgi:hypothetical protein
MPAVNLQFLLGCEHVRIFRELCIHNIVAYQIFTISIWCKELVNTGGLYRTVVVVEMAVNGTLEQIGEYSDGLWLPADFLEEYRFMVAQVIVRISAEGNE